MSKSTREEKKAARAQKRADWHKNYQNEQAAKKAEKKRLKDTYKTYAVFVGKEGNVELKNGYIKVGTGFLTKVSIEHADVQLIGNGSTTRTTVGRVAAGTILAGPIGGLVGAAAKKEQAGTWIVVTDTRTGASGRVPVLAAETPRAAVFVGKVQQVQQTVTAG